MNLGVSALGWNPGEDVEVLPKLRGFGIDVVELAPAKYWPDITSVSKFEVEQVRSSLANFGFCISSLQAFFFGRPELQLFSSPQLFRQFFLQVLDLASELGARHLVFGAPKNRLIPEGMDFSQAWDFAVKEFSFLGREASSRGLFLGVEANPEVYGGNFLVSQSEVVRFVEQVDHCGVRWHLDTGALALTGEELSRDWLSVLGSVHVSEPRLQAFSKPWEGHSRVAEYLSGAEVVPVLEMLPVGLEGLFEAVQFMREVYGSGS